MKDFLPHSLGTLGTRQNECLFSFNEISRMSILVLIGHIIMSSYYIHNDIVSNRNEYQESSQR
jgi:hypothetical protein